ncbi:unnamed protein product, partial [Discosporangium mesarthrocarpum]
AYQVRHARWKKVVELFVLFPVQASIPARPSLSAEAKGGGRGEGGGRGGAVSGVSTVLDLPLPNNGDYGQLPVEVLMAALCLVCRLVAGVSSYLGVQLPHPLFPSASPNYATVAANRSGKERRAGGGGGAVQYPLCPPSKLAESGVMGAGSSAVCSSAEAFETALDLLRSDVVHLCIESAGVPVDKLWPAEALLLNLWEL